MKISVKEMVLVSMFAALAAIGALVVRFGGTAVVPFSILPLVAIMAGMFLGGRLGALSIFVYLILGLVGVPVFAAPPYGGLTYFVKPTAGFLFGFIASAYVVGKVIEILKIRGFFGYLAASVLGIITIYIIGLPYIYLILNYYMGKAVDVAGVLKIAFYPFIGLDLLKTVIAAAVAVPVMKQLRSTKQIQE